MGEKIIELTPKRIAIIVLIIFNIAAAAYILNKIAGQKNTASDLAAGQNSNKPPTAFFKEVKECYAYVPCLLDSTASFDGDGKIAKRQWQVMGRFADDTNPVTKVLMPNTPFNITLKVYDDKGASASFTKLYNPQFFELKIPAADTKEGKVKLIKELCTAEIKQGNYSPYYNGYINDFHAHIMPGTDPYNYTIAQLAAANEFGVKRMAISQYGGGVEGGIGFEREKDKVIGEIAKLCPERFDAMLSAVYPNDTGSVEYVRQNLNSGTWKGPGEIYIKNRVTEAQNLANTSVMMQIYKILAEKKAPLHFHLDANTTEDREALEQALKENPNTNFVWAHSCNGHGNWTYKFDNLYCEVESVFDTTTADYGIGSMKASKVVLGSDASVYVSKETPDVQGYQAIIESSRIFIKTLYDYVGVAIAQQNYEGLFRAS